MLFTMKHKILVNVIADKMPLAHHYVLPLIMIQKKDLSVTVRNRDTMNQERIKIEDLKHYIENFVKF